MGPELSDGQVGGKGWCGACLHCVPSLVGPCSVRRWSLTATVWLSGLPQDEYRMQLDDQLRHDVKLRPARELMMSEVERKINRSFRPR